MKIDWTVSFGTMVHLATLLGALVVALWRFTKKIDKMHVENKELINQVSHESNVRLIKVEEKVDDLWRWFTGIMERRRRSDEEGKLPR